MSCLVRTTTPFINEEILLESLKNCGYKYELIANQIYLPELHVYRDTYFKLINGKYVISYDNYNVHISSLLQKLEAEYNKIYGRKLEEEKERLEKERLEFIDAQKKAITEKAKSKGYRVIEVKKNNKIQITLVR